MKIIWFSRHNPLPTQVEELRRIFGNDTCVVIDRAPFFNAQEVKLRFEEAGGEELVIVAPMTVLHDLRVLGIRPITALMENEGKSRSGERNYSCKGFRRIINLSLETEDL